MKDSDGKGGDEDRKPCRIATFHFAQGPARVQFDSTGQSQNRPVDTVLRPAWAIFVQLIELGFDLLRSVHLEVANHLPNGLKAIS